jgi:hypothetical protein
MSKKILLILFLTLIALAMMVWYFSQTTHKNELKGSTIPSSETKNKKITSLTHIPTKNTNLTPPTPSKKSPEIQNEEEIIFQETELFETLSLEEARLITPPRNNVEPIAAIHITNHALATLKAKDTLTLTDIKGNDYPLTIRRVKTNYDGSVTTTGVYSDEGIHYTTTITQAKGTSYITLSTPTGLYEIETRNDVGYIYDVKDIRKRLHRNHKSDSILYKPKVQKKKD